MSPGQTPSQTVGPYLAIGLTWPDGPFAADAGTTGAFWLRGRLLDGADDPVSDGMVEIWQADPAGRFDLEQCRHPGTVRHLVRGATAGQDGPEEAGVRPGRRRSHAVPGG